jgi:hypothetical protein
MTEREWQRQVIDIARSMGWQVFHVGDSRRQLASGKMVGDKQIAGFPDLTLVHPGRGFIFAELKATRGKLTEKQIATLDVMAAATVRCAGGVRVHVWRPEDLDEVVMPALQGRGVTVGGW